ncbi:MAG: hypothetical protein WC421_07410 [Elusimicrobiales bacterium]
MQNWKYTFKLDDGRTKEFHVSIDPATLLVVQEDDAPDPPPWTLLEYRKCRNCPLDSRYTSHCPIAANISRLVADFGEIMSCASAYVSVASSARTVTKAASLNEGLYSLLGIYMSSSGCPVMDKLKPMAMYHLPFSTVEETVYRVFTMYMGAQYFRMKEGLCPDWELQKLVSMYDDIRSVNRDFAERIRGAAEKDSVINSLVNLDVFAMVMADVSLSVRDLARVFAPYLDK